MFHLRRAAAAASLLAPYPGPTPRASGNLRVMTDHADLLNLIQDRTVVHGRVTLSSGSEADYYIDLRRFTLDGRAEGRHSTRSWRARSGAGLPRRFHPGRPGLTVDASANLVDMRVRGRPMAIGAWLLDVPDVARMAQSRSFFRAIPAPGAKDRRHPADGCRSGELRTHRNHGVAARHRREGFGGNDNVVAVSYSQPPF